MRLFQFRDPFHERVHEKMKFIGEGPASFFRDICRMLNDDSDLESETHLISHLFREIESAVRDAARPTSEKASGSNSHRKDIKNILQKLDLPHDHPVSKIWLKLADQGFEFQFNKLAHRDSLNPPRKRRQQIEQVWEDFLYVLDEIIDRLQGRYFSAIELIDDILCDEPSNANAKILAGYIPHNETTLLYLFNQCDDPEWLPFLEDQDFFDFPPAIIYNNDGTYRYPRWPAAVYLQKVAKIKAQEVSEIIKNLSPTENRRIYEDLVRTIQQMPPKVGVTHTGRILKWILSGSLSYAAGPYYDFALHMAKNGYSDEALHILRAILGPVKNNENESVSSTTNIRISDWEFNEFINKKINEFRGYLQLRLLELICGLLNGFLELEYDNPDDGSYIWIRALPLEPDEGKNSIHEPKKQLLNLLLWEINHLLQQDTDLEKIVAYLYEYNWYIFSRIRLLLYAQEGNLTEIKKILLNADLFDKYWISREYKSVLNQYYPELVEGEKKSILQWIDVGLSTAEIKDRLKFRKENLTEDDIISFNKKWKLRKLHPIAEYLEANWKSQYKELIEEFGEPVAEDELVKTTTFIGPTSPKSPEKLIELSVNEVITYLKEWEPEEAYNTPSQKGLGRVMTTVVKEQAATYSQKASAFKDLIPTYVRSLFSGLREAVKEGTKIHWGPVLGLATFAVEQTDELPPSDDTDFDDPEWQWTRKRLSDLLGEGCKQNTNPIPFKYRQQVWELLEILVEDPQPDLSYEKEYTRDPTNLSINTVRGEAMHALFYYIRWIRKEMEVEQDLAISLDQMPEVCEVLEHHLETDHEPTLTIRSVYGQHLGTLVETDPAWLKEHLRDIFPDNNKQQSYFNAAWNGFIRFHRPHQLFIEYIRPIYKQAIVQLNRNYEASENIPMPDRRLVEHLVSYYWCEDMELDDELFTLFFEYAPAELRGYVLECMGRSLEKTGKTTAPEVLERSKIYIENRIKQAQSQPGDKSYQTELAYWGWCFTTGCFKNEWAIAQLHKVLHVTSHIEHDRNVMQELTRYIDGYPKLIMDCIEEMVKNMDKTMRLHVWKKPLKKMLAQLLEKNDQVAGRAEELVQYISHKSYHLMKEFKQLLD